MDSAQTTPPAPDARTVSVDGNRIAGLTAAAAAPAPRLPASHENFLRKITKNADEELSSILSKIKAKKHRIRASLTPLNYTARIVWRVLFLFAVDTQLPQPTLGGHGGERWVMEMVWGLNAVPSHVCHFSDSEAVMDTCHTSGYVTSSVDINYGDKREGPAARYVFGELRRVLSPTRTE